MRQAPKICTEKLFTAAATEPAALMHIFIFVAVAKKENKQNGQKYSAIAEFIYQAVDTAATAAADDEQYYEQIEIVVVFAQTIKHFK